MQNIKMYVLADSTMGTVVDNVNASSASSPVFTFGFSAMLNMVLFKNRESDEPYPIEDLANVVSWQAVIDDDYDHKSTPLIIADNANIRLEKITETSEFEGFTETHEYTQLSIPLPHIDTQELKDKIGTSSGVGNLIMEVIGFDSQANAVFGVQVPGFYVMNRIYYTGTPTSLPDTYLDRERVEALIASGVQFQYSSDGMEWHDVQDIVNDRFIRSRSKVNQSAEWSEKVELPKGPQGEQGIPGTDGTNGTNGKDGKPSYTYVAYASDDRGTGFSTTPSDTLTYVAFLVTDKVIQSPSIQDFANVKWARFVGAKGQKGDTGATGPEGKQGLQGIQGIPGNPGDRGERGIQGVEGPEGKQGEKGEKGDPGIQGPQGEPGTPFKVDATGRLSEKSAYDSQAKGFSFLATDTGNMYIKNSESVADWSDPIPFRGPKGDQGIKGDTGDTGPEGKQGIQGKQGLVGEKGEPGTPGQQGIQGLPGNDGVSNYTYIAYASDENGTGFSITPSSALTYIAFIVSDHIIQTPTIDDFASATWMKYIGNSSGGSGLTIKEREELNLAFDDALYPVMKRTGGVLGDFHTSYIHLGTEEMFDYRGTRLYPGHIYRMLNETCETLPSKIRLKAISHNTPDDRVDSFNGIYFLKKTPDPNVGNSYIYSYHMEGAENIAISFRDSDHHLQVHASVMDNIISDYKAHYNHEMFFVLATSNFHATGGDLDGAYFRFSADIIEHSSFDPPKKTYNIVDAVENYNNEFFSNGVNVYCSKEDPTTSGLVNEYLTSSEFWIGTENEYSKIISKNSNCFYFIKE